MLQRVVAACAVLAMVGTAACSSSGSNPPMPQQPVATTPTAVGKTIVDTALGNKIDVLKYFVGFQPSESTSERYAILDQESVVLVEVRIRAGSVSDSSFGPSDIYLTGSDSGAGDGEILTTTTTIFDGQMKKSGYPPLGSAQPGQVRTGWLAFTPQSQVTKFVLLYKRLAYKPVSGKTIPARTYSLPLTTG